MMLSEIKKKRTNHGMSPYKYTTSSLTFPGDLVGSLTIAIMEK